MTENKLFFSLPNYIHTQIRNCKFFLKFFLKLLYKMHLHMQTYFIIFNLSINLENLLLKTARCTNGPWYSETVQP